MDRNEIIKSLKSDDYFPMFENVGHYDRIKLMVEVARTFVDENLFDDEKVCANIDKIGLDDRFTHFERYVLCVMMCLFDKSHKVPLRFVYSEIGYSKIITRYVTNCNPNPSLEDYLEYSMLRKDGNLDVLMNEPDKFIESLMKGVAITEEYDEFLGRNHETKEEEELYIENQAKYAGWTAEQFLHTYNPTAMFEGLNYFQKLEKMKEIMELLLRKGFDLDILVYNSIRQIFHDDTVEKSARYLLLRCICFSPEKGNALCKMKNGVPIKSSLVNNCGLMPLVICSDFSCDEEHYRFWMIRRTVHFYDHDSIPISTELDGLIRKIKNHDDYDNFKESLKHKEEAKMEKDENPDS